VAQMEFWQFEAFSRRVQAQRREQPLETIRMQQGVEAADFDFMLAVRIAPAKTQRRQFVRIRVKTGREIAPCFPRRELAQTFYDSRQMASRVRQGLKTLFAARAASDGQQRAETLL